MVVELETFTIKTPEREILVDITQKVREIVSNGSVHEGACRIFIPHTTAGVTINENADPDVKADIISILSEMAPQSGKIRLQHGEGNSDAHLKSSIVGSCQKILIHKKFCYSARGRGSISASLMVPARGRYTCNYTGSKSAVLDFNEILEAGGFPFS